MAAGDIHIDPAGGAGDAPQTGAGAWTYGAWVEIDPSLSTDIAVVGMVVQPPDTNSSGSVREIQIEIGVGASGSEVTEVQIPYTFERITNAGYHQQPPQKLTLPEPYSVPSGSRVAVRVAHSGLPTTAQIYDGFHLIYEEIVSGASVSDTDSGTDSEASTLVVALTATDANGTLTEATRISLVSTDANGTVTETAIVTVPVAGSDSGTDSESSLLKITTSDVGGDSEATVLTAQLASSDAGTDTELAAIKVSSADQNGTTTENGIVTLAVSASDAGTDAEIAVIAITTADTNGTVTEAVSLIEASSATDTGSDSEAASIKLTVQDTGSDSENGIVTLSVSGNDAGTSSETASVRVFVNGSDSGSMSEISNNVVSITAPDAGSEIETTTVVYKIPGSDSGSESEVASVSIVASDTSTGTDDAVLSLVDYEAGVGSDTQSVQKPVVVGGVVGTINTGGLQAGPHSGKTLLADPGEVAISRTGTTGDVPAAGRGSISGSRAGKAKGRVI